MTETEEGGSRMMPLGVLLAVLLIVSALALQVYIQSRAVGEQMILGPRYVRPIDRVGMGGRGSTTETAKVTTQAPAPAIVAPVTNAESRADVGPDLATNMPLATVPQAVPEPERPAVQVQEPRPTPVERALESGQWESVKQLAVWAAREEQAVAALGNLNRRLPALFAAIGGRSSITNVADAVDAFRVYQTRNARVRRWAEERIAAGAQVALGDYPVKEIRVSLAAGDLAWQELYLMIDPLDEAAAKAQPLADDSMRAWIARIADLRQAIVTDRARFADVRAWRHRGNIALAATLLAAVEEWVKSPGSGLSKSAGPASSVEPAAE